MFNTIFSFEVRRLLKSPSTYIYYFILFIVTFLLALMAGGAWEQVKVMFAGEKIYANAPIVIDAFYSSINDYISIIIIVAIVGNSVLRDFRENTHAMIFTTPVTKFHYLFGRFSGAMFVTLLVLTAPALGLMAGFSSPWVSPDRVCSFHFLPYITTFWQTIIPNALIEGTIFFAVSLIARDIFIIWLSLIIFYVATGISNSFFSSIDKQTLASFLDPTGIMAKDALSKYWTTYDKNHLQFPMRGLFLANRAVWLTITAMIWYLGYAMFSFSVTARKVFTWKKTIAEDNGKAVTLSPSALPAVTKVFSMSANLYMLWGLAYNECVTIWRNAYFRIILLFGMLFLFITSIQLGKIFDTTVYPVTYMVVEQLGGTFSLFLAIITIMFGGELVWRARDNKMDNIVDALPAPNWVYYTSKLAGLVFIQAMLTLVIFVCGVIVQTAKGYTHFEVGLYFQYLFGFRFVNLIMLAILSIFVQALVNNKYMGYFVVGLFYFWNRTFAFMVLENKLFIFGSDPGLMYSDMNKFGHGVAPYFIFKAYWGGFCLVLAALSSVLWPRGTAQKLKYRWREAVTGANGASWVTAVVGLLVFIVCGGFIYYNTHVLNKHQTDFQGEEQMAKYEKEYKKYQFMPQPKITDVTTAVDIYPATRTLHATGTYIMKNKTASIIDSIIVIMPDAVKVTQLVLLQGSSQVYFDSIQSLRIFKLSKPLQPGDTISLTFTIDLAPHGFGENFRGLSLPLYNGTFVNNWGLFPHIGYSNQGELDDNNDRKKHGLAYRITSNPITDTEAYGRNLFSYDADFINLDATVSTAPDQIAMAPGYLEKEWTDNGRRYFHYKMDKPIINFFSFLSARWAVKKDKWNDVSLEIYYQPGHEYNLDRMMDALKKALDYYSTNFSPYQYRQVRILEFPRYATFAQSFPNTIPFSEGIGFIANVDTASDDDVDYPFYVTCHELAHQWFAHQVIGADVEGSNILSESMAQYGAETVMEKKFGESRMRKYLHIEMDKYLTVRSNESEKEKPWAYSDPGQQYILYEKGSIEMHALQKYIGEDSLNHAIRRFIEKYAFHGPPYPTTLDLIAEIRKSTPDSLQYFVTDAYQKITIYDNKITDATAKKADNGYLIDVTVDTKKLYADSTGKETQAPDSCNYIEIGVYKDKNTLSQNKMYRLKQGITKLQIPVTEKPYKVVIDPRLLLMDKKLDDNEKKLDIK